MKTNDITIWNGVYDSFNAATGSTEVFDEKIWQDKQTQRLYKDLENLHSTSSIPRIAEVHDYALPVIVAMELENKDILNILDFGGGMGPSFLSLQGSLPSIENVNYYIVDGKSTCENASQILAHYSNLKFCERLEEGLENYHITHFGSSIQYIEDWERLLEKIASMTEKYIIFSDLMAGDIPTYVSKQYFYGKYIPTWFWNLWEFIQTVEKYGFKLIYNTRYKGTYLGKRSAPPMHNLPEKYRLDSTCHLIFMKK